MGSVFQALERGGDAAAPADEGGGADLADLHDGAATEETAEFQLLAGLFADGGDDPDGGGLGVDHADGCFVGDDGGNGLRRGVAGDDDHVETHGADGGHGFQLLNGQGAAAGGVDHAGVLGDGDEGSGKAADVGGGHDAAFLHGVVQEGQGGGGAGAAAGL